MKYIIQDMDDKYKDIVIQNEASSIHYSNLKWLGKITLYLVEKINGPLFTMLSGLITSLSINLLTNFVEIDSSNGAKIVVFSIIRLLVCLIFNISFVVFTAVSMNITNSISVSEDIMPRDRATEKAKQYLIQFSQHKSVLEWCISLSVIWGILTIVVIIIGPFIQFSQLP